MLQGMNKLGKSWVGRIIVAILFSFLIVSFAIWGIGDIFRGGVRTQVARVGGSDIQAETFRNAYQTEYQALTRRLRQALTPDMARALGIEQRVLARLVSEAALEKEARNLGLAVSDALVVRTIQAEPTFQGPSGAFDRARFNDLLRNAGYGEAQFVQEQRAVLARQQLAEAISGGIAVPLAMREAVHRYQAERRGAEYLALKPALLGELPAPTEAQLQSFYEDRKATYRAPEFRGANLLAIDPVALAKPDQVSDEDARAFYERNRTTRFGTPERRTIQQIVFPSREEANAAFEKTKTGTSFEQIGTERNVSAEGLTLGTFTKAEMLDPAAAEAAFALAEGAVSGPVDGRFGPVLLRVAKIEPGQTKSFAEAAPEARREVALERARAALQTVHDAIEDQRASGRPLADIARDRGLPLLAVAEIDRSGNDRAGKPTGAFPDREPVLAAVFKSDVGADNEAVRTADGGYVWYEVTKVEPAKDRPLAEVRDRVSADWRKSEIARLLADKGGQLVERIGKGEAMAAIAAELGLKLETVEGLSRGAGTPALAAPVVTRIFATPVGKAGSAASGDEERVLFKVTGASVAPFLTTTQESAAVETRLRNVLGEDVLAEYMADLETRIGVQVYPDNVRRAIGGDG